MSNNKLLAPAKWIFKKLDSNERELKRLYKVVEQINSYDLQMKSLTDEQLKAKTEEFRQRLSDGETLEDLLPEAYAVVREVSLRTVGMRHFEVQLMGGMALHEGKIAEMKTGEGKTLVATLPVYLNALGGKGVHVITVNDYLAKRDRYWMGPIYEFLGLTVGAIQHDMDFDGRRSAYRCDITYGTNSEFGFDYLRDNTAMSMEEMVQRELNFALLDEIDNILIDEARTPLIISGYGEESTALYYQIHKIASRLKPEVDYTIDEKAKTAMLTEEGSHKVEQALNINNLSDIENIKFSHHANQALKAISVYKKDVDYVVKDGQVIIVDEFTGRLMLGRRYSEGLHQAIEAKENVKIEHESQTLASISYQNYFRLYHKLAGMTGTAKTEEEEFVKIYGLSVVVVPTNKPMIRSDYPDVIYKSEDAKFRGIAAEILQLYSKQQPVLVGTRSIEVSERLSSRLFPDRLQLLALVILLQDGLRNSSIAADKKKQFAEILRTNFEQLTIGKLSPLAKALGIDLNITQPKNLSQLAKILDLTDQEHPGLFEALQSGIPHNVLNAKYHEKEAQIIAEAGRKGAITIATNMAGRGVDIILGGKPEDPSSIESPYHDEVVNLGGLHILGTERHESRRIDNQLRGRSGRQGDPGSSRFYVSLEDELWRLFGGKKDSLLLKAWPEDEPVAHSWIAKGIEMAQKRVESHNFEMRKHVLQFDEVMNTQRKVIYEQRRKILEGSDFKDTILEMLAKAITNQLNLYANPDFPSEEWDLNGLYKAVNDIFPLSSYCKLVDLKEKSRDELYQLLRDAIQTAYENKEAEVTPEVMRELERFVLLRVIDTKWIEHLDTMDYLQEGIGLRAYAQIDPLVAYHKEAYEMFQALLEGTQEDVVRYIFWVQPIVEQQPHHSPYRMVQMQNSTEGKKRSSTPVYEKQKIGRNDPCPCGSGKKFKRCCLNKMS